MKVYSPFKQREKGEREPGQGSPTPREGRWDYLICICIGLHVKLEIDHVSVAIGLNQYVIRQD